MKVQEKSFRISSILSFNQFWFVAYWSFFFLYNHPWLWLDTSLLFSIQFATTAALKRTFLEKDSLVLSTKQSFLMDLNWTCICKLLLFQTLLYLLLFSIKFAKTATMKRTFLEKDSLVLFTKQSFLMAKYYLNCICICKLLLPELNMHLQASSISNIMIIINNNHYDHHHHCFMT